MALEKTVTTPHGFIATDAYHRVEGLRLQGKDQIAFQLRSYKDNSGVAHFSDVAHVCSYELNGANPIAQAYNYVKSLPEFTDAKDC
jgi:hypothetical protein